jgi:hypothetical protein
VTVPSGSLDPLVSAVDVLHEHYDTVAVAGRTVVLESPVKGDAGFVALRVLGVAQAAFPVGAAAHGASSVAIGVWRPPDLYLARWTQNRWVVGYRLPRGSKPADYIGSEGRIPGRFEIGHWYATVPDEVRSAFAEVGLSLEAPPFPPPDVPPPPEPTGRSRRTRSSDPSRATAPSRPAAPRKAPPVPKPAPAPTSRVCLACNMRKALTQFTADSDLCVDCR